MTELCQLRERANELLDEGQNYFSFICEHGWRCYFHVYTRMQKVVKINFETALSSAVRAIGTVCRFSVIAAVLS